VLLEVVRPWHAFASLAGLPTLFLHLESKGRVEDKGHRAENRVQFSHDTVWITFAANCLRLWSVR
jgi:hypothetical protein